MNIDNHTPYPFIFVFVGKTVIRRALIFSELLKNLWTITKAHYEINNTVHILKIIFHAKPFSNNAKRKTALMKVMRLEEKQDWMGVKKRERESERKKG